MSCYLVDDHVIDYILSAYLSACCRGGSGQKIAFAAPPENGVDKLRIFDLGNSDDLDALGQILIDANYRSVAARYSDHDAEADRHQYRFKQHRAVYEGGPKVILQAMKALSCLDYQSCEYPGYYYDFPKRVIDELYVRLSGKLPGLDDAAWGAPPHLRNGEGMISLAALARR